MNIWRNSNRPTRIIKSISIVVFTDFSRSWWTVVQLTDTRSSSLMFAAVDRIQPVHDDVTAKTQRCFHLPSTPARRFIYRCQQQLQHPCTATPEHHPVRAAASETACARPAHTRRQSTAEYKVVLFSTNRNHSPNKNVSPEDNAVSRLFREAENSVPTYFVEYARLGRLRTVTVFSPLFQLVVDKSPIEF